MTCGILVEEKVAPSVINRSLSRNWNAIVTNSIVRKIVPTKRSEGVGRQKRSNEPAFPLYRQIVKVLRDEILKGQHLVGTKLPTEGMLAQRFSVSRHTIREALRQLRSDGLVSSRQGAGTTIERSVTSHSYVHEVASIHDLIQYATSFTYKVDSSDIIETDGKLSDLIGAEVGQKWLRVSGFRYGEDNDRPVCWTQVYIHTDYARVDRLIGRRSGAVYELIEDLYGQRVMAVTQAVKAKPMPAELVDGLQVEPNSFAIEVIRTYKLSTGKVAEIAVNYYPANRFSLVMNLRRSRG